MKAIIIQGRENSRKYDIQLSSDRARISTQIERALHSYDYAFPCNIIAIMLQIIIASILHSAIFTVNVEPWFCGVALIGSAWSGAAKELTKGVIQILFLEEIKVPWKFSQCWHAAICGTGQCLALIQLNYK